MKLTRDDILHYRNGCVGDLPDDVRLQVCDLALLAFEAQPSADNVSAVRWRKFERMPLVVQKACLSDSTVEFRKRVDDYEGTL